MSEDAARTARRFHFPPGKVLPQSFYDRETEVVARELLGAVLECRTAEGVASGRIVETEAYIGEEDPACHAAAGFTNRTRWLYGAPGTAYVYFIYGMYWCFNAVTRAEGLPSAVLVRAVEPVDGFELIRARRPSVKRDVDLANGPGKLCLALGINGEHNGVKLWRGELRIRAGEPVPDEDVLLSPRIGITKAADWPLRWMVGSSDCVSATPRGMRRVGLFESR
jgi:DNA-3-methyladenine glycosylase